MADSLGSLLRLARAGCLAVRAGTPVLAAWGGLRNGSVAVADEGIRPDDVPGVFCAGAARRLRRSGTAFAGGMRIRFTRAGSRLSGSGHRVRRYAGIGRCLQHRLAELLE